MPTQESVYSNFASFTIEGQVDLTAAGEISAVRGDGLSCTYSGSGGSYPLVYKGGGGMKLVQVLSSAAWPSDTQDSATTAGSIESVAQDADSGNITVTFVTQNAAGGAATEEATAVVTMNVRVVIQTARMSNPLD